MAADDFYFSSSTLRHGIHHTVLEQYKNFSGRWAAHYLLCLVFYLDQQHYLLLFLFSLITGVLLLTALHHLLQKLFHNQKYFKPQLIVSLFVMMGLFLCAVHVGENWLWYTAVCTYLYSLIAFLFLLNILCSPEKSWLHLPFLIVWSLFIGGASESFALIQLLVLACIWYGKIILKRLPGVPVNHKLLIFSSLLILISFFVSYLAPGTAYRTAQLPSPAISSKIYILIKTYGILLLKIIPPQLPFLLLCSSPWFIMGIEAKKNFTFSFALFSLLIKSSALVLVLLFIVLLPTSISMSDIAPARAQLPVTCLLYIYFSVLFFCSGAKTVYFITKTDLLKKSVMLLSCVALSWLLIDQYNKATQYSTKYDERMSYLKSIQHTQHHPLQLEALDNKSMLYWQEIKHDSSFYVNQQLKISLGLRFEVVLKEEK